MASVPPSSSPARLAAPNAMPTITSNSGPIRFIWLLR